MTINKFLIDKGVERNNEMITVIQMVRWVDEWQEREKEQLILSGVSNALVADIRNKLTPINNLVAMLEDMKVVLTMDENNAKFINTEIAKVKYTIEYLSNL